MVKMKKWAITSSFMTFAAVFAMANGAKASPKIEFTRAKLTEQGGKFAGKKTLAEDLAEAASNEPIKKPIAKTNSKAPEIKDENKQLQLSKKVQPKPVNSIKSVSASKTIHHEKSKVELVSVAQMNSELGLVNANFSPSDPTGFKQKENAATGIAAWQKIGSPYQVNGIWYIPSAENDFDESGNACVYRSEFQGRITANGEVFDNKTLSIAHPSLPMPGLVEITNLETNNSVIARVNDRGPFTKDCNFGISKKGADLLGFSGKDKSKVRVRYVGYAQPKGNPQVQQFALNTLNPSTNSSITHDDAGQTFMASLDIKAQPENELPQNEAQALEPVAKVQLAAFRQMDSAKAFIKQLPIAQSTSIVEVETANGTFYRVYELGKFDAKTPNQAARNSNIDHNSILASL